MNRNYLLTALATASLMVGGQALAQGRGGGHGQGGVGIGAQTRGGVGVRVGTPRGNRVGVETRTRARVNSQGPVHANIRARTRANENSVLRADLLPPNLVGLRTGLTVRNRAGARIGTISRIVTSDDGRVRTVLVTGADGRHRIRLSPSTIIVDGDVATTTAVRLNRD
jgi:hypothetical protein